MQGLRIHKAGKAITLFAGERPALTLKPGDVIRAEVVNIVSGDTVTIRVKGQLLKAQTDIPLQRMETLMLRVEVGGDEVRLRIIGGGRESPEAFRDAILAAINSLRGVRPDAAEMRSLRLITEGLPPSVRERLPQLAELERLLPPVESFTSGSARDLVESSGIFFERKLRLLILAEDGTAAVASPKEAAGGRHVSETVRGDLKGTLYSLKGALGDPAVLEHLKENNVKPDMLLTLADKLLKNIEYYQLLSRLNDSLQVFIPLIWKDLRHGELIFGRPYRNEPQGRGYFCIVNLDLEGRGRMTAHILLQAGRFHVRFISESVGLTQRLKDGLPLLEKRFETSGLKLGNVSAECRERVEFKTSLNESLDIRA